MCKENNLSSKPLMLKCQHESDKKKNARQATSFPSPSPCCIEAPIFQSMLRVVTHNETLIAHNVAHRSHTQ